MRMKVPTVGSGGADDRRADLRHAAHHERWAKDRDQPLGGVDAVLQRDDRGVGTDQRPDPEARAFDVPQLDANSTMSTLPISAGSSVARVGTRWVSPRPP